MGKISTTDIKEYRKDKSLVFLSKNFYRKINTLKSEKIVRCDNELCRRVLPAYQPRDISNERYHTYLKYNNKRYCDVWCKEQDYKVTHKCKRCGVPATPILNRDGRIANWRTVCDDCFKSKKHEKEKI